MILVTGASGFIGRVLVHTLKSRGYQVRALLRKPLPGLWDEEIVWDLASPTPLSPQALEGVTTVFHLAGIAHSYGIAPRQYYRVNVEGTQHLVRAARRAGVASFVYFSSVKAVADPPEGQCVDEDWNLWPLEPYGYSKRLAEKVVLLAGKQSSLHVTVLRPALVYGPGVKGNLRRFISLVERGWMPPLPPVDNRRSYVHVQDVVEAALSVAGSPRTNGNVYIVAEPRPYSTTEIYLGLLRALGRTPPRWRFPLQAWLGLAKMGDLLEAVARHPVPWNSQAARRFFGSACYLSERLQKDGGWVPKRSLLESLPALVTATSSER